MTIPSTPRKAGPYYGTGAQTSWPFAFKVFAAEDVRVTVVSSTGVESALVLDSDYSVTINEDQDTSPGGSITYPLVGSPLSPASRLVIAGDLDYDQPMDIPSGGNFAPEALENELDRIVMQMQQLLERMGRTVTVSLGTSSDVSLQLPVPLPTHVIGWDQSGAAMQNYSLTDLVVSSAFSDWVFDTFTGNGAATTFGLQRSPGTVGNTDVSVDGVTLVPNTDFTVSGSTVTFVTAPSSGAQILVRYGSAAPQGAQVGAYQSAQTQVATGGQTAFSLAESYTPGIGALSVYVNGVRMALSHDYLETNSTLVTFTYPLAAGDRVLFIVGMEVTTGAPGEDGAPGRGIVSVVRTSGTGAPGTTDTYTITYTDATTSTFFVYNGADGAGVGDMTKAVYDTDNDGIVDAAESVPWTGVTGKPSTFTPSTHTHIIGDVTGLQTALDDKAASSHTHTANQISDSTTVGRAVMTAADAAAARAAIGAGTGSGDVLIGTAQTLTAPKRGTVTVDNDLSFDMAITNNFACTTAGSGTLTFTNIAAGAGQSGFIKLVNASNHTISAAATTKVSSTLLARVSVSGTFLLSYFSDGTNVYVVASEVFA